MADISSVMRSFDAVAKGPAVTDAKPRRVRASIRRRETVEVHDEESGQELKHLDKVLRRNQTVKRSLEWRTTQRPHKRWTQGMIRKWIRQMRI